MNVKKINRSHNPKKSKEENSRNKLIDLVKEKCELFSNHEGRSYARFTIDNHKEVYAIESQDFIDYLHLWHYRKTNGSISKATLDSAITTLNAIAKFDGRNETIYIRTAQINNTIYIDLVNDEWQCVKVSFEGVEVLDNGPVAFTRNNNMKPLPMPNINYDESKAKEDIKLLHKHINIKEDQLPLVVGWMLMAMQNSEATYPILMVNGGAGSGKTTACEMIRELVDPNKANLISQPNTNEMRIVGADNHILAFDNVSKISPNFSDSLCKIASGDNQVVRKLYSTNTSFMISTKKPLILNGIPELAKRSDLGSRSVKINLGKIWVRKTAEQTWIDFNNDKSAIFDALLTGVCISLATYENIEIDDMTRMADFCKFSTASHIAYGWNEDTFMRVYNDNVKMSHVDSLESSMLTTAIMKMFDRECIFEGRPIELLEHLEERQYVPEKTIRSSKWVSTPKGVVEALDRADASLEVIGIMYEKYKDNTNKTFIKLELDKSLIGEDSESYPTYKNEPDF